MNLVFVCRLRRINEFSFIDARAAATELEKLRNEVQGEKLIAERP